MIKLDSISFKNNKFPIREIELPEVGMVYISVNALNEILLNDDGSYFSNEAEAIDNMIYYFVNENEIVLPEKDLSNLLLLEVLE